MPGEQPHQGAVTHDHHECCKCVDDASHWEKAKKGYKSAFVFALSILFAAFGMVVVSLVRSPVLDQIAMTLLLTLAAFGSLFILVGLAVGFYHTKLHFNNDSNAS